MTVHPLNWPARLSAVQCLELRGLVLEELAGDEELQTLVAAGADQAVVELLEARADATIERPVLAAVVLEQMYAMVDTEDGIGAVRTLVMDLQVANERGEQMLDLRGAGWVKRLAAICGQALITAVARDAIAALAVTRVSTPVARWGAPLTHQDVAIALRGHVNGYRDPLTKTEQEEVLARDAEQAAARIATAERFAESKTVEVTG